MWIRKTNPRLRAEKWRDGALFALGCMAIGTVAAVFLSGGARGERWLGSLAAMAMFLAAFGLFHLQRKRIVMCEHCQHPQHDSGAGRCACGGQMVDVRQMQWIEPSSQTFQKAACVLTTQSPGRS